MPRPLTAPLLLAGLLALLLPAAAGAQDAATLRGIVTAGTDGQPLQGANVVLEAPSGAIARAAVTNPDGFYEINGIAPGRYPVQISFIGYRTHRDTLQLTGERRTYNVVLELQERALDEVTVEARRGAAHRQAGVQTVRPAALKRIPTPGPSGDLAAYVQTLPGVVSGGDRGGQLYIRGGTPSQNLVLVDGLPIVKPFHISGLFSAFPQEIVKSADVYAGGFGAEYMGAISSVIDVSLRGGNKERYVGSASASPFIVSARLEGPVRQGRDSFLGVARHSAIEETAGPLLGREVPLRFYDVTGHYTVQEEASVCSAMGMRTYDRGRLDTGRNVVLTWSNTAAGMRCLIFNEGFGSALELTGGYSRFENAAGTGGAPERSASLAKTYVSVDTERSQAWGALRTGARGTYTQYAYELDEKFVALNVRDQFVLTAQAYAAMDWKPNARLTVSPSVGTNFSGQFGTITLEPRLRLSFRPGGADRQEWSLAVGKYNQIAEGITDERDAGTVFTVWVPAQRDTPLPQALHAIAGYRRRLGAGLEASIEGYVKGLQNIPVPQWTPVARFNTRTTLADGLAYGVDARAELDAGPLYLFLGYGWASIAYEAAREDLGAWSGGAVFEYAPAHDVRHQLNAVASYGWRGFDANVSWALGSGRPYTQVYGFDLALRLATLQEYPTTDAGTALTLYDRPYDGRLPTYHRLDVSVGRAFDLAPHLTLEGKLGALNLYDRRNIFYYDANTLRRADQMPLLPYLSLRVLVD